MDLIILSENGFAPSTDILNLADQLKTKKMKKKEAEQVLKVFVEDKWLSEVTAVSSSVCILIGAAITFLWLKLEFSLMNDSKNVFVGHVLIAASVFVAEKVVH